ncbi:39S ribosomal protein S18a, mitochondrial-like [Oppia nitens]|uniref:39S ribosomal protein S18a, mitochondrial-like n=1 Tax=Oppia nitens TaxID=1686743 RepID=UPI0023DA7963|nr:39S ribosomal protein S18a, mitochondrial-like [Oppia nitens]
MNCLLKSLTKKLAIVSNVNQMQYISRHISLTTINRLKEIKYTEKDDTITVEAVKVKSDRTDKLVTTDENVSCKCCPLCRLNLRRLNYTDILILQQFVESDGKVMPRSVTGLCERMHQKVYNLVNKAQRCQLMPRPLDYQSFGPWDQLNTYYEWPPRVRDKPKSIIEPRYWSANDYQDNHL